ncbi:hypothetical protein Plhal304r1_c015g0056351 [Plasmopara halstedii]
MVCHTPILSSEKVFRPIFDRRGLANSVRNMICCRLCDEMFSMRNDGTYSVRKNTYQPRESYCTFSQFLQISAPHVGFIFSL